MSNLIEQLGGYEKARELIRYAPEGANFLETYPLGPRFYVFDIGCNRAINIHELRKELLEHRRAHDIFGVGDRIVKASRLNDDKVYRVFEVADSLNWVKTSCGAFIDAPMFRHATDAEIKAGHRLPQLEVLNDIDIPPNTIILGDK